MAQRLRARVRWFSTSSRRRCPVAPAGRVRYGRRGPGSITAGPRSTSARGRTGSLEVCRPTHPGLGRGYLAWLSTTAVPTTGRVRAPSSPVTPPDAPTRSGSGHARSERLPRRGVVQACYSDGQPTTSKRTWLCAVCGSTSGCGSGTRTRHQERPQRASLRLGGRPHRHAWAPFARERPIRGAAGVAHLQRQHDGRNSGCEVSTVSALATSGPHARQRRLTRTRHPGASWSGNGRTGRAGSMGLSSSSSPSRA
jgi:hypothetical protein